MRRTGARFLVLLPLVLLAARGLRGDEPAAPAPYVEPEIEAMRPFLGHESWAVRSVAAWDLRFRREPGVAALLSGMLATEANDAAVDTALAAVASLPRENLVRDGGPDLVERVFRHAEDPNGRIRARVRAALDRLAPVRLGRSIEDYRGWWVRGKEAHVREQRDLLRAAEASRKSSAGTGPERKTVEPLPTAHVHVERVVRYGLEVCVVMDHTGSMGPVIAQAKANAVSMLRRLAAMVPQVRAGLVTYDDGAGVRVALTSDETAWVQAFRKVTAAGGGDIEEGVDKALRLALRQEKMGWSRTGVRVLVVVGDAPPHEEDVPGLLTHLRKARQDDLYENPVVVHTVSTDLGGVPHFAEIAAAGGGAAVTLGDTSRLADELVGLAFGGDLTTHVREWMAEVDRLRRGDPL